MIDAAAFDEEFSTLTGKSEPFSWQRRLFGRFLEGKLPAALDLPTGLGKTSVMAIWLIARAHGAQVPRRLVYVVDRRAVVDHATEEAQKLRKRLEADAKHLKELLGLGTRKLPISTLRGQFADNREWQDNPAMPAIIVGTVDMIGSRLLFSGYGVSRKMRPYHAGLLGADVLVVLDEAHLVPPFENLLETIETGTEEFAPRREDHRNVIPSFKLLSLSATGRERQGDVFRLCDEDLNDAIVKKRLEAKKHLTIELTNGGKLESVLAEHAWALSCEGKAPVRILVYSNSRETAEKTKSAIEDLAKGDKKTSLPTVQIDTELFVGARRVKERELAKQRLQVLGFLAHSGVTLERPAFLIATSAGEVGVDLDADHMVCDLVPWERVVQRLGRVNRRGDGDARIIAVDEGDPKPKKADEPTEKERLKIAAHRALQIIQSLPSHGSGFDASPGALRELKRRADGDDRLKSLIDAATTPVPLQPALTRPLVDAWSMTSLEEHTGRPKIGPWLRGWIDDEPQTAIVWRKFLPVRIRGDRVSNKEIADFFEAAPPHLSEELETETRRAVPWLMNRANRLAEKLDEEKSESKEIGDSSDLPPLTKDSVVAFLLAPDGTPFKNYKLRDIVKSDDDKKREERFESELAGKTLVVDARLEGLKAGLLEKDEDGIPQTADSDEGWSREVGQRVRRAPSFDAADDADWRFQNDFACAKNEEGDATEWLIIERPQKSPDSENGRSISKPQSLRDHQNCVVSKANTLAGALGLGEDLAHVLKIAARLHDAGKSAPRWQRAFNAPRDDFYAKTKGPINQARLDGYRHEFGSLPCVEKDSEF